MANHYYPNPGIYLPLMTDTGEYVFGDAYGDYYSVPIGSAVPEDWYQVCMSPEDIKAMLDAGATLVQLYTGVIYEGMSLVRRTCKMMIAEANSQSSAEHTSQQEK